MNDQSVGDKTALCPRCGTTAKLRARVFSDQALAALVAWDELESHAVGQHICGSCYDELREVLIDRETELAARSSTQTSPAAKPAAAAHDQKSGTGNGKGRGVKVAG